MALFKTFVLQEKTKIRLSTLRYRTFAIGAYVEKMNNQLVLKIALSKKEEHGLGCFGIIQKSLNNPLNSLMRNWDSATMETANNYHQKIKKMKR